MLDLHFEKQDVLRPSLDMEALLRVFIRLRFSECKIQTSVLVLLWFVLIQHLLIQR